MEIRGGVIEKSTWIGKGGWPNVHVCPQGGRGGLKNPEKPSTWFVDGAFAYENIFWQNFPSVKMCSLYGRSFWHLD